MERTEFYLFVLMALLIAAAYYVGLTTDAKAVLAGVHTLVDTSTGRTSTGAFANYPR